MDNEAASTNYGEDANTVNVPEKPKPAPVSNATQPSTAPARSNAETPAAPAASTNRTNTTAHVSREGVSAQSVTPSIETTPSKVEEMLLSDQSATGEPVSAPQEKTQVMDASNETLGDNTRSATIPLALLGVEALSILGGLLFMRRR